ncbi:MAG: nicotinate-nucleotide--dimethylbenzimidazole phosphoribosyltransferase [Spirochaetia bacterium]|nr:nicotinate-nucleotide--dimethylbenzimidazole phosphoribosyltransferase [Spirochaetia bacterium]
MSYKEIYQGCITNWNTVAKPLHSLGLFEDLIAKIAAAQEISRPYIAGRTVLVFCADNGIVEEEISQSDHSVTTAVAASMAAGFSNANLMAREANAHVEVYDVGMVDDIDGVIRRKSIHGTRNFTKGPAMTREEAEAALDAGRKAAEKAKLDGNGLVVIGEMGIGNTTTAAAVLSVFLDKDPALLCGRGSGLSDAGLKRKIEAVKKGIALNKPDPADPIDIISKVGGADIAAMCGVLLAAPKLRLPVVLDGLISCAAAVAASRIDKNTIDYILPSHKGKEPGCQLALEALGLKAPIAAELALGEGTGGIMLLPLLDIALAVYNSTHSFDSIGIKPYKEQQ